MSSRWETLVEQLRGAEVHLGIRLVVSEQFRGQDAVPGQRAILCHVHQQGYIPIRQGRQDKAFPQVRESRNGIRPGLKPVPHPIELDFLILCQAIVELERAQHLIQGQAV